MNLSEILRGHNGLKLYCALNGDTVTYIETVRLSEDNTKNNRIFFAGTEYEDHIANSDGSLCEGGECMFFPSKDDRDWESWFARHNSATWKDYCINNQLISPDDGPYLYWDCGIVDDNEAEACEALYKILTLIKECYGGLVTKEEWASDCPKFVISPYHNELKTYFDFSMTTGDNSLIAFHTEEQAKKFLIHEKNVELLKTYFMI